MRIESKYELLPAAMLVIFIVFLTWRGALKNDFVSWDDYAYVVDNELVRGSADNVLKDIFTTGVSLNYHPLTIVSLRLNKNECKSCPEGISPKPFIRGNIILHTLNSLLVLIMIYILTGRNMAASVFTSVLFAIHPMHVESVTWIAERKDVLYSFFFLSGLISFAGYIISDKRKFLLLSAAFVLFVLSCLSKAAAVVFPLVLILISFWFNYTGERPLRQAMKNTFSIKNLLILIPFFTVSIFLGIMAVKLQNNESFAGIVNSGKSVTDVVNTVLPLNVLQRFQVASYGLIMYIVRFILPVNLMAFYPYPDASQLSNGPFSVILWLSLAVVIILAAAVLFSSKKTKLYIFGALFFFITIALVLQFVSVGNAMMADRYSYMPYIGLALVPAVLISQTRGILKWILFSASGIFLLIMMLLSINQVKTWKNTETLWSNVIEHHPELELARRSRGKYYLRMSGAADSEQEKRLLEDKALRDFSVAIKQNTKSSDVYEGSAIILSSRGEAEKALLFINRAISMNPGKGGAYYNRAMIYDMLNDREAAINDYSRALNLDETLALKVLSNRSVLFLEAGRYKQAARDIDLLISMDNKNPKYFFNRAFIKVQLGNIPGAIEDYRKVLALEPDNSEAHKQLEILIESGKPN